jgi:hypothetical protein
MAERVPSVALRGWEDVRAEIAATKRLTEHLWFLGGEPHEYDRWSLANHFDYLRLTGEGVAADTPDDGGIPYYQDPLGSPDLCVGAWGRLTCDTPFPA